MPPSLDKLKKMAYEAMTAAPLQGAIPECANRFLDALPPSALTRAVVLSLDNRSHAQVAARLDVPRSTVASIRRRSLCAQPEYTNSADTQHCAP